MQTNRVILANESRLLRGMLRRVLAKAPGLEVVGEVTDPEKLPPMVDQGNAEWVVVSIWPEGIAPSALQSLLGEHAPVCVLGMAADGSQAKIACAGSREETRNGLSLDDLIAILHRRSESS